MNRTHHYRVLGALLIAFPLVTAYGQDQVAEPGTFDPETTNAHQTPEPNVAVDAAAAAPQLIQSQAVKIPGRVIVPESSIVRPGDAGRRAHTNHLVFVPQGMQMAATANMARPQELASGAAITPNYTFAENPGSIGCVYRVGPTYAGCTPAAGFGKHPVGGSGAIAIVDAYHNPNAESDLAYFSAYFGLPAANFTQVYCLPSHGSCNSANAPPATNKGWGLEEALDIEWAHAMAPNAKIFLIEAASNSMYDLTWAEAWAGYYVDMNGGGQVSNSWGGGEFAGETAYDSFFNNYSGSYKPVVYLASSGDSGTVEYPSASPFVVSVGGTTINRDISGNFLSETCWSGTGRGASTVEAIPSYQSTIGGLAGTKRWTTDISFDADPASGVWVYDALNGGWFVVGGTSLSAPAMAGIMNNAGNKFATTALENNLLYSEFVGKATKLADFYDPAPAGYDACTGIGTPRTLIGK
jgi:kumamolisin